MGFFFTNGILRAYGMDFLLLFKKIMKEKIYEPARHNEESPAEGMAAVNTFTPEETSIKVPEKAIEEAEERGAEEEEG